MVVNSKIPFFWLFQKFQTISRRGIQTASCIFTFSTAVQWPWRNWCADRQNRVPAVITIMHGHHWRRRKPSYHPSYHLVVIIIKECFGRKSTKTSMKRANLRHRVQINNGLATENAKMMYKCTNCKLYHHISATIFASNIHFVVYSSSYIKHEWFYYGAWKVSML